jgi:hypothetical protein
MPFAVDYWKTVADKVIVLDNGSDDGSVEYLEKIPWVEVRHFGDGDGFNDRTNAEVKNNVWKESRGVADFVIVTDFDEFMYAKDLKAELQGMKDRGETIVKPRPYQVLYDEFPEHEEGRLAHETCDGVALDYAFQKCTIFNPNEITEINYGFGAHRCRPEGNVKWYTGNGIFLFHCKYLGIDYLMRRNRMYLDRMSLSNTKLGGRVRYSGTDSDFEKLLSLLKQDSVDISSLFCG